MRYILENKVPVKVDSLEEAIVWEIENKKNGIDIRRVARDEIGDVLVSTIFLGTSHNYYGGAPLLFETMIFGGKFDQDQFRYSTWGEAEKGHAKQVTRVVMSDYKETKGRN